MMRSVFDRLINSIRILSSVAALSAGMTMSGFAQDDVRSVDMAVANLDVADGLEVSLIASEPLLVNPSNIDVDHLGRIWVCEVVNYRHFANKDNPPREEGDRILVLEDTDRDGVMDQQTVFYQGRDIDSPHGVCVLGNRVLVSAGENVFSMYDDDGDLKADRKEVLFTGIKGTQHDHGIHSFTFGPDGRLYFNFGNAGNELHRPDGSLVVDISGREVVARRQPYQEGMAFRCEADGSKVDTLGWNFRNNWELCVDSFGTVWQSDNDDDGNRGVRINFVMEYGNYGYKDEFTGAGWRDQRTNLEAEVPLQHWHLNDPGVVPNLLQTGAGSPTGIMIYEGDRLPDRFVNQLIHCDAGPNVVRSYATTKDGAGYKAEINDVLTGARDQWFRPSDVCAAPDGSLIVADWYDPGVGGHRQGDLGRGRLFRVSLPGLKYEVPEHDFSTIDGAAKALLSPNVATRYLAFQSLREAGAEAESALSRIYRHNDNQRFRARALWLLGQIDGKTQQYVTQAANDPNPDIRIVSLRLARRMDMDVTPLVQKLAEDSSSQVRRECAVALRNVETAKMADLWGVLAARYEPQDRWYLEALGLAADGRWDECMQGFEKAWEEFGTSEGQLVVGSIIWRSRGSQSAQAIVKQISGLAKMNSTDMAERYIPALFRALDFQPKADVSASVAELLKKESLDGFNSHMTPLLIAESLQRLGGDFSDNPDASAALERALADLQGTTQFVQLVQRFQLKDRYPDVLQLAQDHPDQQIGVEAIRSLLALKEWKLLTNALQGSDLKAAVATAQVMGLSADGAIAGPLMAVILNGDVDLDVRREAVRGITRINNGAQELAKLIESDKLDPKLTQAAAAALHAGPSRQTRELAARLFPLPPSKDAKPLPPLERMLAMPGDARNGGKVFHSTGTCHKCHQVGELGKEVGPNLSEIGSKLSREAMFESILYPSAGISHNYEGYSVLTDSGNVVTGLLVSETDDAVSIKSDDSIVRTFKKDEIEEIAKMTTSFMPADLQKLLTAEELVDVVAYMQSLKKK